MQQERAAAERRVRGPKAVTGESRRTVVGLVALTAAGGATREASAATGMADSRAVGSVSTPERGGSLVGFVGPLADRLALHELNASYGDVITRRDLPGFGQLWHPKARWIHPTAGTSSGIREIVTMCEKALQNFPMVILRSTVGSLAVQGASARGRVYVDEVVTDAAGKTYRVNGLYDDEYARTERGWRYQRREYRLLYNG